MSAEICAGSIVRSSGNLISTELDDCVIILHLRDNMYFRLESPVSTLIWGLIQEPVELAAIRDAICARFRVSREECEANLVSFVGEMRDHRLVEVRAGQGETA